MYPYINICKRMKAYKNHTDFQILEVHIRYLSIPRIHYNKLQFLPASSYSYFFVQKNIIFYLFIYLFFCHLKGTGQV